MAKRASHITILFVPEGTEDRKGIKMRFWLFRMIVISVIIILVGIVLFFVFYGSVLPRAAMTDRLIEENEQLQRYKYKVTLLENNLKEARNIVSRVTELAGIDYEFPEMPDDSILFSSIEGNETQAILTRSIDSDLSWPQGLPMQGFITQDFEKSEVDHFHPGIDIACAVGTPVLSTAAGVVSYIGYDSTYGKLLVIQHNDSVSTVYGHNDTVLVKVGQDVLTGSRVALSGNTGISTAPHLHYEVRINNQPINPIEKR